MPDWNQTPEEMLANLGKIVEEFKAKPPIPIGLVFKASLKGQIEAQFERRSPTTESKILPFGIGIPIFYDLVQQENCIEFFDPKALRLYLNRRENPKDWALYLAEIIGLDNTMPKFEPKFENDTRIKYHYRNFWS